MTDCYEEQSVPGSPCNGDKKGDAGWCQNLPSILQGGAYSPSLLRVIWAPLTHMFGVSDVRKLRADQWQLLLSQRVDTGLLQDTEQRKQAPMEEYTLPCFKKKK